MKTSKYKITDEQRHYLDAILPNFKLKRIADILTSIKETCKIENSCRSDDEMFTLYLEIKTFLAVYEFGNAVDHVFLPNQKCIELQKSGSLAAFEESEQKF